MAKKEVWVVIPAFNEQRRIKQVLEQVKKQAQNVLVVDDGSADETLKIAKEVGVHVLASEQNQGKGAALRKGCEFAIKQGADILVTLDADGQHDPTCIPKLVEKIEQGSDVCFTYRKWGKEMPWTRRLGNWSLNAFMRILFGRKPRDMLCGFVGYTKEAYKKLKWETNRYGVETELVANCVRRKLDWTEVEIPTIYYETDNGVTLKDAIEIGLFILRLRVGWHK